MYAVWYPRKGKSELDRPVNICRTDCVNGKRTRIIVEKHKKASEMGATKEIVDKYIEERIKFLEEEQKKQDEAEKIESTIDFKEPLKSPFDHRKNGGFLFLEKAWYDLEIDGFLNRWVFDQKTKIQYSLSQTMRLLCFGRVIFPGSKIYTVGLRDRFLEKFDVGKDDIYDVLDRIDSFSGRLERILARRCASLLGSDPDEAVYYDCTNFYFEVQEDDDENGLRAHGVEKNHRPDPIVEYGIMFDGVGFPTGSITFRGGKSEKPSLKEMLKDDAYTKAKIICADCGLNSQDNKDAIHESGRNYIFCQSVRQLADKAEAGNEGIRTWATNGKDMTAYGEPNKKGEKCSYKERWIKRGSGLEERLIVKFDPDSRDFILRTIEKRVERAKKFIKNPSSLEFKNCQDGKEYIKRVEVDKETAEVKKGNPAYLLDEDKIKREKAEAGYYCFVTDIPKEGQLSGKEIAELKARGLRHSPKGAADIIRIAGRRVQIEDCFRTMKTNMAARPIFVRTTEHIRAHLFSVYVALVLVCYLKLRFKLKQTEDRLFDSLRNYEFADMQKGTFMTLRYDEDINELMEGAGLVLLRYRYLSWKKVKEAIAKCKNRG